MELLADQGATPSVVGNGTVADLAVAEAHIGTGEQLLGVWRLSDAAVDAMSKKGQPNACCVCVCGIIPVCWPIIYAAFKDSKTIAPSLKTQLYILTNEKLHIKVAPDPVLKEQQACCGATSATKYFLYTDSVVLPIGGVGDPGIELKGIRKWEMFQPPPHPEPEDLLPQRLSKPGEKQMGAKVASGMQFAVPVHGGLAKAGEYKRIKDNDINPLPDTPAWLMILWFDETAFEEARELLNSTSAAARLKGGGPENAVMGR